MAIAHRVAPLQELGGLKPTPTPAGVPVAMMSPGARLMLAEIVG